MFTVEPTVAQGMVGDFASLRGMGKWPERPPANTLRGVDFYSAHDLARALAVGGQQFKNRHGYLPRLAMPETFSEQIFLRKYVAPIPMPSLADKLVARDYVKTRLGKEVLPAVVWVGDSVSELAELELINGRFVLKANNGCNFVRFLNLPDELRARREQIERRTTHWLTSRFGYAWGEWQYCTYKPKLYLEEFLDFNREDVPDDFKFFCFGGKAHLIEVDVYRFTDRLRTAFYDPSWKHIPVAYRHAPIRRDRPDNLEQMIYVAETLANGFDFVRIDLYSDGKHTIKFGEITFTPGNACSRFSDVRFDKWLGTLFGDGPHEPFE